MKTTILWVLVAVNALLLGALLMKSGWKEDAALAQAARRPGEYLLVPGEVTGIGGAVVYVVDVANGEVGGFAFDVNGNRLDTMPAVELGRVMQGGAGPGGTVAPGVPGQVPPGTPGGMRRY